LKECLGIDIGPRCIRWMDDNLQQDTILVIVAAHNNQWSSK